MNLIKKSFLAWLVVAILSAALSISSLSATDTPRFLSEDFLNVDNLSEAGWFMINKSTPVGTSGWGQGNASRFESRNTDNSYIYADFRNTTDENTISNFLLTPELTISNGSTLTFYTRRDSVTSWPDRLLIRLSTSGGSTDVGDGISDFGDFSTVLLSINPDLNQTDYPRTWTQYTVTVEGLESEVTGRFAFHYDVENGGPFGRNSDYIGIDSVTYQQSLDVRAQATPSAGGTVSGDGSHLYGSEITLQATPNSGYRFVNWTDTQGAIISTEDAYEWTVNNPLDITANFELSTGSLVISITPSDALSSGAAYSVDGGINWITSDRLNLVPGEYSVTFKDASGWVTPDPVSGVIITADTNTSITVNYLPEVVTTPTPEPTVVPSVTPTAAPTVAPTAVPTIVPSVTPTLVPTIAPTAAPTIAPTVVVPSTTQANKPASGTSTGADTSAKTMDQTDSTEAPTPTATPTSAPAPTQVTEPSETAPSADQQQDKSSSTTPSASKTEASSSASKIWSTIGFVFAAIFVIGFVVLVIIIVKKKKGRR